MSSEVSKLPSKLYLGEEAVMECVTDASRWSKPMLSGAVSAISAGRRGRKKALKANYKTFGPAHGLRSGCLDEGV